MSPYYYGEYRRVVYTCQTCGKSTWAEVATVYRDKEKTHRSGNNSKQRRWGAHEKLCQSCYEGPQRLVMFLRSHGYSAFYDDWGSNGQGQYWAVLMWGEPEPEVAT